MGLRALLEGICVDMGIEDRKPTWSLEKKLDALAERSLVRKDIVDNLRNLKFMGDDAAHHREAPTEEELMLGIEVVEDLISFLHKESEHQLASGARRLAERRRRDEG